MQKSAISTILLLFGVVLWGMTFAFIKEAVQFVDPFSFISVRFFIASFVLTIIFARRLKNYSMEILKIGAAIGLLLALTLVFQTIGLQYTTASNGGFITGISVIFVLVFVSMINKKIPSALQTVSVLIAFAGLALVVVKENLVFNIGDIWVLLCAIVAAFHLIAISKFVHKIDASLFALTQFYTVAIFTFIVGFFLNGEIVVSSNWSVWQAILFTALFATVYMYTAQAYLQRFLTEIKTAILFAFEPLFAAIFAFLYLSEIITLQAMIGGLMIFVAMIISQKEKQIKERIQAPI